MRNYAYYFIFFVSECDVFKPGLITDDSSTPVQLLQQLRQQRLREECLASSSGDSWPGMTFVVSHDLRYLFCNVPKAASTSWLRILLRLTGNPAAMSVASTDRHNMHRLNGYYLERLFLNSTRQLARSPLKDYYKFMFVREPLERLVSAYRDRMFRAAEFIPMRRYIIRKFRRHPLPRCRHITAHLCDVSHSLNLP